MKYKQFILEIEESNASEWQYDEFLGLFLFSKDIRITILKGASLDDTKESKVTELALPEKYSPCFYQRFFLCFNGQPIETLNTLNVDERIWIPLPDRSSRTITPRQYRIATIINRDQFGLLVDQYLHAIGIRVDTR